MRRWRRPSCTPASLERRREGGGRFGGERYGGGGSAFRHNTLMPLTRRLWRERPRYVRPPKTFSQQLSAICRPVLRRVSTLGAWAAASTGYSRGRGRVRRHVVGSSGWWWHLAPRLGSGVRLQLLLDGRGCASGVGLLRGRQDVGVGLRELTALATRGVGVDQYGAYAPYWSLTVAQGIARS